MKLKLKTNIWGILGSAALILSGFAGVKMRMIFGIAPFLWLPTGVALAMLVLVSSSLWPYIFAASVILGFILNQSLLANLFISIGGTLGTVVGAYLLRKLIGPKPTLTRLRDVNVFILVVMCGCTVVSTLIKILGLYLAGRIAADRFLPTWRAWALGEAMGLFVVGGFLINWVNDGRFKIKKLLHRKWEFLSALFGVATVCTLNFTPFIHHFDSLFLRPFILFSLMLWIATRFETVGIFISTLLVVIISLYGMSFNFTPFMSLPEDERVAIFQIFLAVLIATGIYLAAAIREKDDAVEARNEVIEAAPNGLLMIDRQGRIILCNAEIETLFGYSREDLMGRAIELLIPDRSLDRQPGHRRGNFALPESRQVRAGRHLIGIRKDGTEFPLEIGLNPVQTPEGPCVLASILDITERKAIEQRLHDAISVRDDFMSIASHELKTPLTSLSLQIQMAKQKIRPETNSGPSLEKIAQIFDASGKQVNRLENLIEDLMDVSRIQRGKFNFNFEVCNVSEIVSEMTARLSQAFQKSRISLHLDIEKNVIGRVDRTRIEQVIDNILTNAIKYAPGSLLNVSLFQSEGQAHFIFADTGPGIPLEKQAKIFDRFERAAARNVGGLGLGLFIVREIVTGHGGTVRLEGSPGKGSKFVIALPLAHREKLNEAVMA